jgi:alkanesulfonate monooxygenase SsuD/methylene tetrahydromethanopterin reductase-like flavin-dependent oxidoreductase (luciferase family)
VPELDRRRHPGPIGFRISATGSTGLEYARLDETWHLAHELDAFDAGWMSDHLTDASQARGGPALEALTTIATLAHRVPGRWVGVAVLAATFRHPAVLAKAATALDLATGGRFILGLGAGWHEGEHEAYGIPLPPLPERYDRFESSLRVLEALFSSDAATPNGVDLADAIHPLRGAVNLPAPATPGGPPLWLGGQRRRGLALAARYASGWPMPGNRPGDVAYFTDRRDAVRRALEAAGRDPDSFSYAAQLSVGASHADRREALATAEAFRHAGATHVILGLPATDAPRGLVPVVEEVARPLRTAFDQAAR